MINIHFEHIVTYKVAVYNNESVKKFVNKIPKYNSGFEVPDIKPTEKRNYTIGGIAIVIGAVLLWLLWQLFFRL